MQLRGTCMADASMEVAAAPSIPPQEFISGASPAAAGDKGARVKFSLCA